MYSILSKKSLESNVLDHAFIEKGPYDDSLSDISCCSFLTLKKRHEGKKGRGASLHPTLNAQQLEEKSVRSNNVFFYTPMLRCYFGVTPPNPRFYNRRLLRLRNDYIDWYMNVYLKEDFPWEQIDIGNERERVKRNGEGSHEESKQRTLTVSITTTQNLTCDKIDDTAI